MSRYTPTNHTRRSVRNMKNDAPSFNIDKKDSPSAKKPTKTPSPSSKKGTKKASSPSNKASKKTSSPSNKASRKGTKNDSPSSNQGTRRSSRRQIDEKSSPPSNTATTIDSPHRP